MNKKKAFTIIKYITLFLIIWNLGQGIFLLFKHAYLSSLFSLVISHSLIGWYFYTQEIITGENFIEEVAEHRGIESAMFDISKNFTNYHLDKIIELTHKRMVHGLKDEQYVMFINDILDTIHAFAQRCKTSMKSSSYEEYYKNYFKKEGQECKE